MGFYNVLVLDSGCAFKNSLDENSSIMFTISILYCIYIQPGEGNGYPLQYSGLENFMDRGAWQDTVHVVAKIRTKLRNFILPFN